jgi:hypothetical protein
MADDVPGTAVGASAARGLAEPREPCEGAAVTPENTVIILRRHLRMHNLGVLAASGFSLLLSVILWAVIYGIAAWVTFFGATLKDPTVQHLPRGFNEAYAIAAVVFSVIAWLDGRFLPNTAPPDKRWWIDHVRDVILFTPRLTLSIWQNFSALAWLKERDWPELLDLLDHLRIARRLPLSIIPQWIPDERRRLRVLFALQVAQVLDLQRGSGISWLHISSLAPKELRLNPDHGNHEAPAMWRPPMFKHENPLPRPQRHTPLDDRDHL